VESQEEIHQMIARQDYHYLTLLTPAQQVIRYHSAGGISFFEDLCQFAPLDIIKRRKKSHRSSSAVYKNRRHFAAGGLIFKF
jgi:hypothetical protein